MATISTGSTTRTTEVIPLVPPQVNASSVGATYTDTVGNTYSELTGQTHLLMPSFARVVHTKMSGHVSAGTGSFQLWNVTDGAELGGGAVTTTSTTEAELAEIYGTDAGNNGDELTIRVKNSSAGASVTLDGGGMAEGDAIEHISANTTIGIPNYTSGQFPHIISIGLLRGLSTSVGTMRLINQFWAIGNNVTQVNSVGDVFTEADSQTVISRTPEFLIAAISNNTFAVKSTGVTGYFLVAISYGMSAVNI